MNWVTVSTGHIKYPRSQGIPVTVWLAGSSGMILIGIENKRVKWISEGQTLAWEMLGKLAYLVSFLRPYYIKAFVSGPWPRMQVTEIRPITIFLSSVLSSVGGHFGIGILYFAGILCLVVTIFTAFHSKYLRDIWCCMALRSDHMHRFWEVWPRNNSTRKPFHPMLSHISLHHTTLLTPKLL